MEQKYYKRPVMKIIELDDTELLAQSKVDSPQSMNINHDQVDAAKRPSNISEELWGKPW